MEVRMKGPQNRVVRLLRSGMNWIKDNGFLVLLAFAVALLAFTERSLFDKHPHWQILLKELAFAAIIAALYGLTIEKYQREEFIRLVNAERKDLQRDVFLYAYGHEVHNQIREEIRKRVLEEPLQRENLVIDWEFSPVNPDVVKLEKRYTYILRNNAPRSVTHVFDFTHHSASEKELDGTDFQCLKIRSGGGKELVFEKDDMNQVRLTNQPHTLKLSREFEVPPREAVEVFYYLIQYRPLRDEDNYATRQPLVGTTTVVVGVNTQLPLQVSAWCKTKTLEARPDHSPPGRYSWQIKEGFLPFQSIGIYWSPIVSETEEGATPT